MPFLEVSRDNFVISTDPARLDVDAIHRELTRSYWAGGIARDVVARALSGSLCFGVYDGTRQIGLARVITDYATFAYLCDVYIEEGARNQGLGSWLIEVVRSHPDLRSLRRLMLATRDAHAFYERHSFGPLVHADRFMEVFRDDAYAAPAFAPPSFTTPTLTPPNVATNEDLTVVRAPLEQPPFEALSDWTHRNGVEDSAPASDAGAPPSVRVRPLAEEEGTLLRRLRLGALEDSPHTFGERLDDAINRPLREWVEQAQTLAAPGGPRLFITEVDAEPAGLVLVVEDPLDPEICRVGGMWVRPNKRRRGAGYGMLKAALSWAEEHHKRRLRLWVQEDAGAARALYESFGFSYTGARKPFPREPSRQLLEMDLTLRAK